MFTELRNAINAAEWILSNLEWAEKNLMSEIEQNDINLKSEDDCNGWYKEEQKELAAKVDALNAVKACLQKFVKSA